MDELPSAEFRKRYARLTTPTLVTVNGHPIGYWVPGSISKDDAAGRTYPASAVSLTQAQRDELLRKINRGK